MITTPYEKIQNDLRSIPKEQLMSMGNNPSPQYPTYMIATEMQRRVQEEKAMAAQQTRDQAGQPTVVEGVMDEFANTDGLSQAQPMMEMNQQMPQEGIQMMATGGRVGYQEGKRLRYTPNLDDLTEQERIKMALRNKALFGDPTDSLFSNQYQMNIPTGDGLQMAQMPDDYYDQANLYESPMERSARQHKERDLEKIEFEESGEIPSWIVEALDAPDFDPDNMTPTQVAAYEWLARNDTGEIDAEGLADFSAMNAPFNLAEIVGKGFDEADMPIAGAVLGLGSYGRYLNPKNWIKGGLQKLGKWAKRRRLVNPKRGPGKVKTTYKTKRTFKPNKNGPDKRWNNKKQEYERGTWKESKIPSSTGTETGKGRPIQKGAYEAGKEFAGKIGKYATGITTAGGIGYGGYQAWDNILSPEARQADEDAINAEELAVRESQEREANEKEARQATIDARKQLNADALIAEQDRENQMSLQALATQKTESAKRDKQMQGLDMARFGLSIAGARNISELSEGLGGIVTDMQTRRREDQEYERGDELIQAQIGQLKALAESYAIKGQFAKVRELNDFVNNSNMYLAQMTMLPPDHPNKIALGELINAALTQASEELGLGVPSGPPDNTTDNQNTIDNSPYVN